MDEIIPGLWLGDLPSALDVEGLKARSIFSILSAMRGRVTINETFIRHQIKLDDTEDEDVLMHFLPSIHFIQSELDKGRGVLVHCQAGISRSSTIVAAYLMYSQKIDPQTALEMIKKARPCADPNQGFLRQLELFHEARYKISRTEKPIRKFYMERAVEEVMNGDGSLSTTEMFAKFPPSSSDILPPVPVPRRRIRCKMCRQELATREHMLDHGQLGPATVVGTPAISRTPSTSSVRPLTRSTQTPVLESLSSINENPVPTTEPSQSSQNDTEPSSASSSVPESAENNEKDPTYVASPPAMDSTTPAEDLAIRNSELLGRQLSDAVISTKDPNSRTPIELPDTTIQNPPDRLVSPADLSAELFSNPKLAALRDSTLPQSQSMSSQTRPPTVVSAPILVNPKCSGYFVEPMKWMEHFLSNGQLAGKITCPNKKCNAKLGNYDWAGVCCGCKEWVTPGFCINRSKVDEVL